jgi:hypothetical protein
VHVNGSVDDGDIDQLQVDTKYSEITGASSSTSLTRRSLIGVDRTSTDAGAASLPISFPLVFQLPGQADENSRVVVTTISAGKATGVGVAKLGVGQFNFDTPKPGTAHSVDVGLTPASKSDCFNPNIFGSSLTDKTDHLCGGTKCQACTATHTCSSDSDCVFPLSCTCNSSCSTRTCQ